MKDCKTCKLNKSLDEFFKCKSCINRVMASCKSCQTLKYENREYKGKRGTFNLKAIEYENGTKMCSRCEKVKSITKFNFTRKKKVSHCKECERERKLEEKYGININKYLQLLKNQNNKCKICPNTLNDLHIDHCHTTNTIRGLLCPECNKALGLFKDNINSLKSAIKYLEESNLRILQLHEVEDL